MINHPVYKYRYRPHHSNPDTFLIEFPEDGDDEDFGKHLLHAILELKPRLRETEEVILNGEWIYRFSSHAGSFIISRDTWTTFILGEEAPTPIIHIHNLLLHDKRFEHID